MSRIVPTELGRFRQVRGSSTAFLFECPACFEWLPMSEEHLNGSRTVEHYIRDTQSLCHYFEAKPYGEQLIATMQARILMDEKPYDEETL